MFSDFPSLHPLAIHFPVVLILMAAIFQLIVVWKPHWQEIRWVCLFVMGGAFFSALAASTLFHAMIASDAPKSAIAVFEEHEKYAQLTLWMSGITLLLKGIGVFFKIEHRLYEPIVLIAAIIAAVFLSIAGHHGAKLTHIEGVGPKGKYLMEDHGGSHDEKDMGEMKGMDMSLDSAKQVKDSMPDMKGMGEKKGMDNMKPMKNMSGSKDMKEMDNMKGMNNMKPMKNMDGVKDMKETGNMKGMDNMKAMKGMDNMKDMPGMDTLKNMKSMDMPGMNMKGNKMDSLIFPDNNPARKKSKKQVKQ